MPANCFPDGYIQWCAFFFPFQKLKSKSVNETSVTPFGHSKYHIDTVQKHPSNKIFAALFIAASLRGLSHVVDYIPTPSSIGCASF